MAPSVEMKFRDRRRDTPQRTVAKVVEFKDGRWTSTPIRLYVGSRKAARV